MVYDVAFEKISLFEVYEELMSCIDTKLNKIFELLGNNFDVKKFIPSTFYSSYYSRIGKNRQE